jgi:RNA polymerase sigma-70 factor (ECF subfamily)
MTSPPPSDGLAATFLTELVARGHDEVATSPAEEVARALADAVAAARAAHPGVLTADEAVVRHFAAHLDRSKPVLAGIASLRGAELLLARACAAADRQALLAFEADAMRGADGTLARRKFDADVIEEAKQNVRERMLVGPSPDGDRPRPRILDYDGRGELKGWLAVAILREAIHLAKRGKKAEAVDFDFVAIAEGGDDPEVAYFKKRYRAEYKESFQAALAEMPARERALLRQQYILGMNVDAIGAIYQVHRATAARWVQAAREELLSRARLELGRRVGLARPEIEQIVRMIESQLDVSFQRMLETRGVEPGAP